MVEVLLGSVLLSVIHAAIPNHWLPLVAVSRTEQWSLRETLGVTAITGVAHAASTILLGIGVGFIGLKLSRAYSLFSGAVTPSLLLGLGVIYLIRGVNQRRGKHHHRLGGEQIQGTSRIGIVASLTGAMFLSPCIEIQAYYVAAGSWGWVGVSSVSTVYLVVTVLGMILLVGLSRKGIEKARLNFLARYDRAITGVVLILLGILAYLIS